MKVKNILAGAVALVMSQAVMAKDFENAIFVKMDQMSRVTASANKILGHSKNLLSSVTGLQIDKVVLGDWVKVTVTGARSKEDIIAASNRLKSLPGISDVILPTQKRLHTLTSSSFNDPGWASQFVSFSGNGSSALRANLRVSPQLDLVLGKYASQSDQLIFGVIDSGIISSIDFDGRILSQKDYFERDSSGNPSDNATPNGETCATTAGLHGTHVASVIGASANNGYGAVGIAPNAKFHIGRVFDCEGDFSFSGYISELERLSKLETNRPAVINLSLGDFVNSDGSYDPCSSVEQAAITLAIEAGIIVVASAGNDGSFANGRSLPAPASCNGVISVGAVDNGGRYTNYSTVATQLDIATFGGGTSDRLSSEAYVVTDPNSNSQGVNTTQGTSFASPSVAAVLGYARMLDPTLDVPTAVNLLQSTAYQATSQTDSRCAGNNCFSLKAANFLAAVEGIDVLPGPVSEAPGTNTQPNPDPSPQPNPVNEGVRVEVRNFAGGYDDICSITVTNNAAVSIVVEGISARCQTAGERESTNSGQIINVIGAPNTPFSVTVDGFMTNQTARTQANANLRLTANSVETVTNSSGPTGPQVEVIGGGGGGGSMSILGLLGLFALTGLYRRKIK